MPTLVSSGSTVKKFTLQLRYNKLFSFFHAKNFKQQFVSQTYLAENSRFSFGTRPSGPPGPPALQLVLSPIPTSVERIEDFCDPNPFQHFQCVIQSDPNPLTLSKYLIQSVLYKKKTQIKHWTAVINAVWTSISDPLEIFSKSSPIRIRF